MEREEIFIRLEVVGVVLMKGVVKWWTFRANFSKGVSLTCYL